MKKNIQGRLRPVELGAVSAKPTHDEMKRLTRGSQDSGAYDYIFGSYDHGSQQKGWF